MWYTVSDNDILKSPILNASYLITCCVLPRPTTGFEGWCASWMCLHIGRRRSYPACIVKPRAASRETPVPAPRGVRVRSPVTCVRHLCSTLNSPTHRMYKSHTAVPAAHLWVLLPTRRGLLITYSSNVDFVNVICPDVYWVAGRRMLTPECAWCGHVTYKEPHPAWISIQFCPLPCSAFVRWGVALTPGGRIHWR